MFYNSVLVNESYSYGVEIQKIFLNTQTDFYAFRLAQ